MFQKPVFGRKGASVAKPEEKKGFAPLLSGLFEGVGPQPDLGNLSDELKRIDLFGRGLGRKALRFVATGEPVGFAQELEAIVDKVGRTVWASEYFSDSEAKNSTQLQSAVTLAKGEIADPQAVARFIAVRRAVYPHERTLGRGRPDLPNSELLRRRNWRASLLTTSVKDSTSFPILALSRKVFLRSPAVPNPPLLPSGCAGS
jgi:hypothetical protein